MKDEQEAAGVKAIMEMQALAGINESEEEARAGWASLSEHERQRTLLAYDIVCKKKSAKKCVVCGKEGDSLFCSDECCLRHYAGSHA